MGGILPVDRFMQASSNIMRGMNDIDFKNSISFPYKLMHGYVEEKTKMYQRNEFCKALLHLEGVFNTMLVKNVRGGSGHSIGIHIDRKNRIFRMYDPNFGIVRIPPTENDEETSKQFSNMVERYLSAFYPSTEFFIPIDTKKVPLVESLVT